MRLSAGGASPAQLCKLLSSLPTLRLVRQSPALSRECPEPKVARVDRVCLLHRDGSDPEPADPPRPARTWVENAEGFARVNTINSNPCPARNVQPLRRLQVSPARGPGVDVREKIVPGEAREESRNGVVEKGLSTMLRGRESLPILLEKGTLTGAKSVKSSTCDVHPPPSPLGKTVVKDNPFKRRVPPAPSLQALTGALRRCRAGAPRWRRPAQGP